MEAIFVTLIDKIYHHKICLLNFQFELIFIQPHLYNPPPPLKLNPSFFKWEFLKMCKNPKQGYIVGTYLATERDSLSPGTCLCLLRSNFQGSEVMALLWTGNNWFRQKKRPRVLKCIEISCGKKTHCASPVNGRNFFIFFGNALPDTGKKFCYGLDNAVLRMHSHVF